MAMRLAILISCFLVMGIIGYGIGSYFENTITPDRGTAIGVVLAIAIASFVCEVIENRTSS